MRTANGGIPGFNIFQNDLTFAAPVLLTSGSYWLVLHNGLLTDTASTDYYWATADLNATNTASVHGREMSLSPPSATWDFVGSEYAFFVSGNAVGSGVPEPASVILIAGGLVALALRKRT